jgi:OmpA-OmpF porin, OOP family
MKKILANVGTCALAVASVLSFVALGAAQETTKVKGLIVARDGANMSIKGELASWTVVLSDDTKVQAIKGKLGLRKEELGLTDLIPGVPVEVETMHSGDQLAAVSVKFKADDLKTARQIQAGLNPTAQQLQGMQSDQEALTKKFGDLSDYDVKGEVTVYFAINSTSVSDESKQQLKALADNATKLKGYMVQVAGYTDSSGNADYNQELSDRRADAVVNYLQQECHVPLYRVLAPEGMGESNPAGSNESAQGKNQNRRVEVKVLVNRGMSSGS